MKDYNLENRKLVIGGIATVIVAIYILRLFTIQLLSDDYRKSADSNAFLKHADTRKINVTDTMAFKLNSILNGIICGNAIIDVFASAEKST